MGSLVCVSFFQKKTLKKGPWIRRARKPEGGDEGNESDVGNDGDVGKGEGDGNGDEVFLMGDVLLLNEKLAIAIFEAKDEEEDALRRRWGDEDFGQIILSENEVFKFFFVLVVLEAVAIARWFVLSAG